MEDELEGNTCWVDNQRDAHKEIHREEQERRDIWKRAGWEQIHRKKKKPTHFLMHTSYHLSSIQNLMWHVKLKTIKPFLCIYCSPILRNKLPHQQIISDMS